jgi:hypothetical protein
MKKKLSNEKSSRVRLIKQELIEKKSQKIVGEKLNEKHDRLVLVIKNYFSDGTFRSEPVATLYKSEKIGWVFAVKKISDEALLKFGFDLKKLNEGIV